MALLTCLSILAGSLSASGCDRQEERLDRLQSIVQGVGDQVSGENTPTEDQLDESN